jgi:UDP-GlcNAc:undecaprenyl-phosphate GlcNAc-1-phosphate transferase
MHPILHAFLLAAVLALTLTPLARRLAWALDFLDRPTTPLKTQRQPVAYLGGVAVALAFGLSVLWVKFTRMPETGFAPWPLGLERGRGIYAIGLGGLIALVLGLLDDKHALSPAVKFLGQLIGALLLLAFDIRLRFVEDPYLGGALTVLWVLTVTNALNFVDIMDGLAASLGFAASLAFCAFALNGGRHNDALAAAALAGACLGFLQQNWRPAKIYLGDAGSHFLGFTLAAISLNLRYSHQNELAVFSPLVILALPLFDLALMIIIRTRKGIPPWKGSPDHVPLRLRQLGFSVPGVVAFLGGLTLGLGALVYAASFLALRQALLFWAGLAGVAFMAGAWLMSIEMPHNKQPLSTLSAQATPSRRRKRSAKPSP